MKELKGLTVIMVGGTGGMGSATALNLAKYGMNICVCSRSQEKLDNLEAQLKEKGVSTYFKSVDLADVEGIRAFVNESVDKFGSADILINFAGVSLNAGICELTEEQWDTILNANLKGIFFATQAFANRVDPEKGGLLINFSSMASLRPGGGNVAYTAAKGAVRTITEFFANQFKSKNIKCTTMSPGPASTTFFAGRKTEEQMKGFLKADDIAELLEYVILRSDRIVFHELQLDSYSFFNK